MPITTTVGTFLFGFIGRLRGMVIALTQRKSDSSLIDC